MAKSNEHYTAERTPIERARQLVPFLSERAQTSEKMRRLAPESFEALRENDLFKVYVPTRFGGLELTPAEAVEVFAEVSRGDGAAGWVTTIMGTNGWMVAQFPEAVQEEIFGGGDPRIVGVLGGGGSRGDATKVEGGYLLSGFWPFCSGCHYANWVVLAGKIHPVEGGEPEQRIFLVRQSDLTIKDDWYTTALAGSGSNSVTCKDVFVPSKHVLDLAKAAGQTGKPALYAINFVNMFAYQLTGAALGFARAAIEHFVEAAPKRGIAYTFYEDKSQAPVAQLRLGEAMIKVEAATALAHRDMNEMLDEAVHGQPSLLKRGKRRAGASYVERLCLEAVETLYLSSGANAITENSPMQRVARDIHANNMHGIAALDTSLELLGRLRLGLQPNTYVI
ncbi:MULTISPECIES: acyl-CoA dehydrogenase family protein [Paraburkholderia]|uniref:Acyl-CoA dehydrogenase family protein n=1 Tax=Paraburkholderia metrosideri TaxID=580937 RepID=A0ABW9E409_9BURK